MMETLITTNKHMQVYKWMAIVFLAVEIIILCSWTYLNLDLLKNIFRPGKTYSIIAAYSELTPAVLWVIVYCCLFIWITFTIVRNITKAVLIKNLTAKMALIFVFMIIPAIALIYFFTFLPHMH